MLNLYDCNNFVRRRFEVDNSGMVLRHLFNEAMAESAPSIYVFDGRESKVARRQIYAGYKGNRMPAVDLFYTTLATFKELMLHAGKVVIDVPHYEADDVIAQIVRSTPAASITIHSTDRDYCALENDFVKVTDAKLKDIPASEIRLYKTLVGDASDCVPGVKGFGLKGWQQLSVETKEKYVAWLDGRGMLDDTMTATLKPKQCEFVQNNWSLLNKFWQIVDFIPVSAELMSAGTQAGPPNLAAAEQILRRCFQ